MAPSFIKAFTVHLNNERRKEIKYKIILAAHTLFSEARSIYAMSSYNPLADMIETRMEKLMIVFTDEFLNRCRTLTKTRRERICAAAVVRKHIIPTINMSFDKHIERLNRKDTLNVLNDATETPRFLISGKIERFRKQVEKVNKKLKIQVTI